MGHRSIRLDLLDEWSLFLRRVSLFHDLEHEDLKEVARRLQPLSLPKGATLYRENEPADALYIIQSGRVKALTLDDDGSEKILNFLGRGETFGETALLTGASRTATIKVDTPAAFLVLYKKDFESFLTKNPKASFYLHRVISQKLLAPHQKSIHPPLNPEVLGFLLDLEKEDRMIFMANLALSLIEQTKRKVLLVEMGTQSADLVKFLGLESALVYPSIYRIEDLSNPKILERMSVHHPPSGLEIIALPEDVFSSSNPRAIAPFITVLHESYDYVLFDVTAIRDRRKSASGQLDDLSKTILNECDSFFHVHCGENLEFEKHQIALSEPSRAFEAVLGPVRACSSQKFYVPWSDEPKQELRRTGTLLLNSDHPGPTKKILNRIARAIGRIQVGLAMGSGAAYGYTLIGMLKVFEREKIPIDYVSGTSMGALIGSFFASGKSAYEIEAIAHTVTKVWLRRNIFRDINWLFHGGLIKGDTISHFLRHHLGDVDFCDFPIPFACAATDIMTGDGVVLREGKVWQAVRGSLSLPLIFVPYKMESQFLVDGGLVNPVPTSIIASMGADILISVNITNKASERRVSLRRVGMFPSTSPGFFNVFFKMLYTMQYQIAATRADLSHVLIRPETRNFSWIDLHRAKQIIPLGEEAAEEALTKIKSHLPYFSDFCPVPRRPSRSSSF